MMNVHSNTSVFTDSNSTDERTYQSSFPYSKLLSSEEQSQVLAGIGGAGEDSQFPHSFQDFGAPGAQFPSLASFIGDMKRTPSNESNSSSMSATSRATTQLKRQNQLASRPLAAKPTAGGGDDADMSRDGSHAMVSMKSKDGSENRAVQQLLKHHIRDPSMTESFAQSAASVPRDFVVSMSSGDITTGMSQGTSQEVGVY